MTGRPSRTWCLPTSCRRPKGYWKVQLASERSIRFASWASFPSSAQSGSTSPYRRKLYIVVLSQVVPRSCSRNACAVSSCTWRAGPSESSSGPYISCGTCSGSGWRRSRSRRTRSACTACWGREGSGRCAPVRYVVAYVKCENTDYLKSSMQKLLKKSRCGHLSLFVILHRSF